MNRGVSVGLVFGVALAQGEISAGDTAWVLVSTALVLMMTPALGLFYAGLVRSKNTLNTFMMSLAAMGVVTLVWVLIAYSLAFAPGNSLVGGTQHALLSGVGLGAREGLAIPDLLFVVFQASFCIITAALISGAVVERMRFAPFLVFMALWSALIYAPLAHWVWGGGWLQKLGVLDFAGGVPVEMASGFSALAAALVLGARKDYGRQALLPHNGVFALLGAGLLWFGWFGFNGGSALAAGGAAALAFANTLLAPAATLVVWIILDLGRGGKATAIGAATAVVVGAVAITPAAGFIGPMAALLLGGVAAIPSYFFIAWRTRTRLDESLDVLAAHGLGGVMGMLFIGLFAQKDWNGLADGLLFGNPAQLGLQALAVLAAVTYSFGGTFVLLKVLETLLPLRATPREEGMGMDVTQHGEEAYTNGEGAILVKSEPGAVGKAKAAAGTD
ncbi:MAG: ammonium transporter [Meiothermus sp.]|nr:ammonium transporter [Meiothermus sp.]